MDDAENDPGMPRPSRSRRPRPTSGVMPSGREREFNGVNELSAAVSGAAAAASNASEETEALLKKLRNL